MANYRLIHTQIWKDTWFIDLEPDEKLLFIYLFSNELATVSGIYKIPLRVIGFETGLGMDKVRQAMDKFQQAGKVRYQDGVIWIKNLRKYNATSSSKVLDRITKEVDDIPECPIKQEYIAYYEREIPYSNGIDTISVLKQNKTKQDINITDARKIPQTALEAKEHPLLAWMNDVTGIVPAGHQYDIAVSALLAIADKKRGKLEPKNVSRYYNAWCARKTKDGNGYNPLNLTWLTDWAVNEYIPPQSKAEPAAPDPRKGFTRA